MDTIPQNKSKAHSNMNSDVKILFVSSDILALIPYGNIDDSYIDEDWILLDGKDFDGGYLITKDEQTIADIIHKCYNARDTQIPYTFIFDYKQITFI